MKKKILKILSLTVVIILCVSVFCINASAKTVITNANDFFKIAYSDLKIFKSSQGGFVDVTGSQNLVPIDNHIYYSISSSESWGVGQKYKIYLSGDVSCSFANGLYSGEFLVVGNYNIYNIIVNNSIAYFINDDGTKTYCSLTLGGSAGQELKCSFSSTKSVIPESFVIEFELTNKVYISSYNTYFDFSIMNLYFVSQNESEAIISNADKNASDIQANADKNANEIKANQDKNANKIINGGRDNPGYSSVDKSATNDYQSKEEEINNQTADARSSTVSFFNNFGSLLNDTPVSKGLLAVSKIMMNFFNIGWLSGLIQFALGIGAFAFILGSAIMVVGKVSSRSRSDNIKRK